MFGKSFQYILAIFFISTATTLFAQRDTSLTQEVEVVKSYKPTISDAYKINDMPVIDEKEQEKPTFNYSIFSQPIYNTFSVNTLKAATFASRQDDDHGYGLVKAGAGNYFTPYGEVFFNSQNIKNTIFGLHARHLSSHAKLKLDGGDKVKAPFSENNAEMFIKHLTRNSILSVDLNFNRDGFNYYGYPEKSVPQVLKEENHQINYFGTKQAFTKGAFNINLENTTADENDFAFDFDFLYHYFGTKTDQREHYGSFIADVQKPLETGLGLLEAGATFVRASNIYNFSTLDNSSNQQIWLTAKPAWRIGGDIANLTLGFNAWFVMDDDSDTKAKLAPRVHVDFAPVKELITIFAGVDGNYRNNHYSKIAYENPFVDPMHDVVNSMEKIHVYGGFDGKFAAKTNFKIAVDYSIIGNEHFYYLYEYAHPTASSIIDNDFDVLYDNLDLLKFNLEIFHASSEKLDLLLTGNYYVYKLDSLEEALNKPNWDAKLSLGYKISEQLTVSTDLFLTGERKALLIESTGSQKRTGPYIPIAQIPDAFMKTYTLKPVIDLNFNANYKITNKFSVFAQLHNFGFQ
ncbi:MAG TPA: hypothetical protein VKA10_08320, partial [Prolixibacteraceae bacterium]|nr:hypothetical protein [Prolixibacteraceae bacterium]